MRVHLIFKIESRLQGKSCPSQADKSLEAKKKSESLFCFLLRTTRRARLSTRAKQSLKVAPKRPNSDNIVSYLGPISAEQRERKPLLASRKKSEHFRTSFVIVTIVRIHLRMRICDLQ